MNTHKIDNLARLREMAAQLRADRAPTPLGAFDAIDLESAVKEIEALREAARCLKELVALKDIEDTLYRLGYGSADAHSAALKEYCRRKPAAWEAAKVTMTKGWIADLE